MYRIYLDNGGNNGSQTLYYPGDAECVVTDAVVKLAIGQAGSCEFTLPPTNPLYGAIYNRKSVVTVYRDNKEVFCGEVRESTKDRNNCKHVYAVGELAWLADTIQSSHRYSGVNATPSAFLNAVIANHNAQVLSRKEFTVGYTTFSPDTDSDDKVVDYDDTLTAIRKNLTEKLGGCLRVRKSGGVRYLDYIDISDYGGTNTQGINFGENLLDYSQDLTASDIATVVIPLGARLDDDGEFEKRLDISDVNNGNRFIISDMAADFGHVWKVVTFDGITNAQALKTAGTKWLTANQYETMTLKVTAVDLSQMDSSIDSMELGDLVECTAEPYGMHTSMYIQEMTLNLMAPQKDSITMSATFKNKKRASISSQVSSGTSQIRQEAANRELRIRNVIRQEVANIMAKFAGTQGGYKVVEFDEQTALWLRDLYMNQPDIELATRIMEISMNGIRFFKGNAGDYTDPTKWKSAWTIDGDFCADFIATGTMLAERILGGILKIGLVHQAQSAQDSDKYSGIECYALVPVSASASDVKKIGEWDKDGLSILYTDWKAGWDTTTGITNGEIRGYFGTGPSAEIAGTLNLVRRNTDNQDVTGDVSLKAEVNDLVLVGTHDALVRAGNAIKLQLGADSIVSWDSNGAHQGTVDVGPTGAFKATGPNGTTAEVHFKNGIIYDVQYY